MPVKPQPPSRTESHQLPTGTITFLFSDVEGSTQRWERNSDAMAAALARHDVLMRATLAARGGYVFKTIGDSFCAAFAQPQEAVAAAVDAQRALLAEDFSAVEGMSVRIALHAGSADERDGDYFGPTVNRVARLLAIGHGGQVLVSGATQRSIGDGLPANVSLIDLGLRRLKDLSQPEQVWQLAGAGLPSDFPPLNSLDARANNLPVQVTPLIGREHEVGHLKARIAAHHVVSILGSGGIGKTRVALQVGADLIDRFDHGVWFADFSAIRDPELVASVVAKALDMSAPEGQRLDEAIPHALKHKRLLLIFDNCEQVLDAAAALADAIQRNAAEVRVLATSRHALGIAGEAAHRLPPLDVPGPGASLSADEALRYGAIGVFVDRASLVDPRFTLTDESAPIVADICRRLDGIPFAIELAAARVKVLSIPNLAQRLNERFRILTGGSRNALPRQKTLSALIDWSYDLLAPQEQLLFTRLGIFAGGLGLDAAASLCGGAGLDEIDILDLLGSLVDKSLIVADTSSEQERYRLLESTAAYALERLSKSGERGALARRHAEYFRDQAEAADERHGQGSSRAWLAGAEVELDNYRAALEWALTQGNDAVLGGVIAGALSALWFEGGLVAEGRYWIGLALGSVGEGEQPRVVARLRYALALLSFGKRSCDEAERALQLYQSIGDARWTGRTQRRLAIALDHMGRLDEAKQLNARALAAAQESGDTWDVANCLSQLASNAWVHGDVCAGRELFAQALEAFQSLHHGGGTALVLSNLAELEFANGNAERALRLANEAIELNLREKHAMNVAIDYCNTAAYYIALGDLGAGRDSAREALLRARRAQAKLYIATAIQHLAVLSALRGDTRHGARLLGYVNALLSELGTEREATERWGHNKLVAALREALSVDEIARLAAEGAAWPEDQAVEEALKV